VESIVNIFSILILREKYYTKIDQNEKSCCFSPFFSLCSMFFPTYGHTSPSCHQKLPGIGITLPSHTIRI